MRDAGDAQPDHSPVDRADGPEGETSSGDLILGQLLRLSARRTVAIYVRGGTLWIADFIDGHGELVDPKVWLRFNCGSPLARQTRRRTLLEGGMPLSSEILARIDALHRAVTDPKAI